MGGWDGSNGSWCRRILRELFKEGEFMKSVLLMIGGVCAAVAALVVLESKRQKPVEVLAQRLEAAWADHHTVV
jgi:hypothetical protein